MSVTAYLVHHHSTTTPQQRAYLMWLMHLQMERTRGNCYLSLRGDQALACFPSGNCRQTYRCQVHHAPQHHSRALAPTYAAHHRSLRSLSERRAKPWLSSPSGSALVQAAGTCGLGLLPSYLSFIFRRRRPPLRFFCSPSGTGSGLGCFAGGGSCHFSIFFCISSRRSLPILPEQFQRKAERTKRR